MGERIGILGGTFQPVHSGHLAMAYAAMRALALDRVVFIPVGQPPHKRMQGDATDADRVSMLELAIKDESKFSVDTEELLRAGPSYTVETLRAWKQRRPDDTLFFILGSDMLRYFPHWREPEEVAALCEIVCVTRAGQSGEEAAAKALIEQSYGGRVALLESVDAVSSTEVRQRVYEALPLGTLVPDAVGDYIYRHMLYQPPEIISAYRTLHSVLSEQRLVHSLFTVKRSIELAYENGTDTKKARLAALIHDCAKQMPKDKLAILSGEDLIVPPVLHASAGAVIAKTVYGVQDDEVLRAIRLHSTGDAGMTVLDKVLYLADITEQTRDFPRVHLLRKEKNLDRAMLLAIEGTLCYIQDRDFPLHPSTLRAYQSLGGKA